MYRSRDENNKEKRYTSVPASNGTGSTSWGDQLILEPVLDDERRGQIDLAPPASPATGDRYIVPPDATGAWSANLGNIAEWNGSAWVFTIPPVGSRVYSRKRNEYLTFITTEGYLILPSIVDDIVPLVDPGPSVPSEHWIPDSLSVSFHQAYQGVVEDISLPISYTSAAYERRIVITGSPAPWDTYIGYIATRMGWAQTGRNHNWVLHQPKTGDFCWLKSPGAFYYYNGTTWVPLGSDISLDELSDVVLTGPTAGQVLGYNGTNWVNTAAGGSHAFGSHSDANANLTAPGVGLDQYVLVWDNASTSFKLVVNVAAPSPHALNDHTDTNLGSPGAGQDGYLVGWDNGTSSYTLKAPTAPGAHTIDSHSNVTITSKATNDILKWNGSAWVNVASNLDFLSDVAITSAALGDVLYYNGTSFVNYPFSTLIASHNHSLDTLSNVSTGGKAVGDFLWWTGSAWANRAIRLADLYDVTATAPSTGQSLVWNGTDWAPGNPVAAAPSASYGFYSGASVIHPGGATEIPPVLTQIAATGASMISAGGYGSTRLSANVTGHWRIIAQGRNAGANSAYVYLRTNGSTGYGVAETVATQGRFMLQGILYLVAFSGYIEMVVTAAGGPLTVDEISITWELVGT